MRALLFFSHILITVRALTCPSQYQLIEGRCIRGLYLEKSFTLDDKMQEIRDECAQDGAHLPIIKNDEENESFNRIANSFDEIKGQNIWLLLDTVCNQSTRRVDWVDGTAVSYNPKNIIDFSSYDCVNTKNLPISSVKSDDWVLPLTNDYAAKTALCVIEEPDSSPCGAYSLIEIPTDDQRHCLKIFSEPLSWEQAQSKCATDFGSLVTINSAEENKYFWRTALSNNFLEGMHIGAHQSTDDSKIWTWVDGEVPFTGKTYSNFIGNFPIPGAGECGAMMTDSTLATWINEDCKLDALPFMCRRSEFSNVSIDCPVTAPPAGEDFYPPGFPESNITCEYVLFVGADKLVEVEVLTLVAETNIDFLEIHEKPVGNTLLANLTGTITTTLKYTTSASNVMRVNWKPNGSGSGKGFRIRYNEVDP